MNGSEPARIETDEGRTYFLIEIPCRDGLENEMDAKYGTINEREAVLIVEIAKQPGIKKNELAEKLDLSVRTISRILQNLSSDSLGLIEYSGSKKTGGYVLTEKGQEFLKNLQTFLFPYLRHTVWNSIGKCIRIRTEKTDTEALIPISEQALRLCGTPSDGKVFKGLDRNLVNSKLKPWLKSAGIDKYITFHCLRHSISYFSLKTNDLQDLNL